MGTMPKHVSSRQVFSVSLLFLLVFSLLGTGITPAQATETRDLVILGTSDIHGNVDNYDYFTDSVPTGSSMRGLTKVASYVNTVKAGNANTIVIDDGDTIQGTPLAYYYGVLHPEATNPMALAMNSIGYTAS